MTTNYRLFVGAGAEMDALRNLGAATNRHLAQVVNKGPLSDGRIVSDFEIPGIINDSRRIDIRALPYPGTKTAQQPAPKAEAGPGRERY